MRTWLGKFVVTVLVLLLCGCNSSSGSDEPAAGGDGAGGAAATVVVNSTADDANPPAGTVTLRSALARAASGQAIVFDPSLDGATIQLTIVGNAHSILQGEVMGMRQEESGPVSYLVGYFPRDYGRSALYAEKDVVIDASALPAGITIEWAGSPAEDARILAVAGNLTMTNVILTGGRAVTEDISTPNPDDQPWTLARGGALAVWGEARLTDCVIYDNACEGDFDSSRDRGAYGGGVYADIVLIERSIVAGNTVTGGGAAGGGVFSVSGRDTSRTTSVIRSSAITGNRISALFCYGAGVYSDGGGIGYRGTLNLVNTTVAENVAEPAPGLPGFLLAMGYWRGGGVYVSNGYLTIQSCTITENEVYGVARTDDLGKSNMAGGVAATIGNAHAVEVMTIGHSVIAGNTVHESGGATYLHDIFTGTVLHFSSLGYNRIGVIDFSQILVPVGQTGWDSLCRRHYPKTGDMDGVAAGDVLDLAGAATDARILSAGVDAGNPARLHYQPKGTALDVIPPNPYVIPEIYADFVVLPGGTNDFLEIMLARLEAHYGLAGFAAAFTADFEAFLATLDADPDTAGTQPYEDPAGNPILTLADTGWFGPAETWPKETENYPYIHFWHRLDAAMAAENIPGMGPEVLGDSAWNALFDSGALAENTRIYMTVDTRNSVVGRIEDTDQLGTPRPAGALGDVGAVEVF